MKKIKALFYSPYLFYKEQVQGSFFKAFMDSGNKIKYDTLSNMPVIHKLSKGLGLLELV